MDFSTIIGKTFEAAHFVKIDSGKVKPSMKNGRLIVPQELLLRTSHEALRDISFYFRKSHLELMASQYKNPGVSENDKLVIGTLLQNAVVSAQGDFALCQDTGTAIIYGWKTESVYTGINDEEVLSQGIKDVYRDCYLRASQTAPLSFFDEYDTGTNLPGQVTLYAARDSKGGPAYRFLFVAKGAGSSNKTSYFSMTKALLEESRLLIFLIRPAFRVSPSISCDVSSPPLKVEESKRLSL